MLSGRTNPRSFPALLRAIADSLRFARFVCAASLSAAAAAGNASTKVDTRTIVFFGDSLTAGYGLENPSAESYPGLIQRKIDAARLPWRVINAGLSGETTAGGLRRVDWTLRQPVDIFVLALGANDGLRGISPEVTRSNLQQIISRVRTRNPDARIVVAGMQMPPILGAEFTRQFRDVFPAVARKSDAALIPHLLETVGGRPDLNLGDGIHPNARGHVVMAETVWEFLQPLL
jgi:acyl-CoA thioesterase I